MELKWLEDLLVLHEEKNFSRAATRRSVTQPAFSRRIRLLEQWIGTELVDRTSQPIRFLPVVDRLMPQVTQLVLDFYSLRNDIKADALATGITIAAQHTLTSTTFPTVLAAIKRELSPLTVRLRSGDLDDCFDWFERRAADFLLCYESSYCKSRHHEFPQQVSVGSETLIPVSAVDAGGRPLHDPGSCRTLKMLNYPAKTFLRKVVERGQLERGSQDYTIECVCESSLAVALKELTLSGMGMCWLPSCLVQDELQRKQLADLRRHFGTIELDVVIYKSPFRFSSTTNRVWAHLEKTFAAEPLAEHRTGLRSAG